MKRSKTKYFAILIIILSSIIMITSISEAITLSASPTATVGQNVTVTITASLLTSVPSCSVDINFGDSSPWANAGVCNAMSPATCILIANHTYTTPGTYTITARKNPGCIGNSLASPDPATRSITINCVPLTMITTSPLPSGTVGQAYSRQIQTSGGIAPISYSIVSGALPTGLSLNSSTGMISGTPSASGNYSFTVRATDNCCTGLATPVCQQVQRAFTLQINTPCPALSITTTSPLPSGTANQAYTHQIQTSGGQSPITFSLFSGTLPPGLSLSSTGIISGIPTGTGTYSFTVSATDSCSTGIQSFQRAFTLQINTPPCPALSITTTSPLLSGTVGQLYSTQMQTSGGQAPITFSLFSGTLPPGLSLSSAGFISGTPTSSGNYSFIIIASDSCPPSGQSVQRSFTLQINPAPCPALSITSPSTLSTGTVGGGYSYQLQTAGGQAPIIFSLTSGSLPPGLILSSTGLISGTPTVTGTYNFTVTVTDSCATGAQSLQGNLSITVNAAPCPALSIISPSALTSGTVGDGYTYQITTSGGQAPITFSIVSGALPSGLNMSASGLISGTPAVAGTSTFTVRAADSCAGGAQTSDRNMTMTINPAPCPALSIASPPTLPSGTVGQSYAYQITTSGGQPPVISRLLSDTYPPGLRMTSTGLISGTPTSAGNYTFRVRVTDSCASGAQSAENDFSITVQLIPPPVTISVNPVPLSFSIPKGFSSSNNVLYQFSGSSSINTTLNSSAGNFLVGSENIGTNLFPLTVQIHNGTGRITEIINVPVAVIERALKRGVNTFIYVRNFSDASINVIATVNFMITTEAGADFEIKRIDLYFENRRPEITVNRGFPKIRAFADIRFVGSGFLQGYWEVDGRMLSHVDQHLTYGASVTLQTPDIPPIPAFDTGSHVVRLVITNPVTDLSLPSIIYFVTAEEGRGKPVNIVLLSPVNYSLIEYASVKFEWEKLDKTSLYFIRFYDKPESDPVFSAYAKEGYYTLPDIALKGVFSPGQKYYWKVSGFDAENKVIGESETWGFTFALEKGKLQGAVVNKK
jgi:hypothetical protein